jgi:HSP20 family molecular chaperone IbpA
MFSKALAKTNDRQVKAASGGAEQPSAPPRAPAVSIYNTDQSIVVVADMPGVTQDRVDITMDHEVLTLRGAVAPDTHTGFRQLHGEYQTANFERSFTLPSDIDMDQVEASVKQGVVTLTLPKNKAVQLRRIKVTSG